MRLNQDRLDEDFMIAKCKQAVRETMESNNFHQIWIPLELELDDISHEARIRAEAEIRREIPEDYTFRLNRIGVAYLAKPKKKPVISFLSELGT